MTLLKPWAIFRNWFFWLCVVTGVATVVRSIPAWSNAGWGGDLGIYYGLTKSVIENKQLFVSYTGWGSSYQYFPVLYGVSALAHWVSEIDVLWLMTRIAPIFGGLTVFILYFIAYELTGDRRIGLASSALLSVAAFHVYQTSHAAPLTMGHFFMLLSLYFFIKYRENKIFVLPLVASTVALIMSHHLTTYFYLISIIFIIFFRGFSVEKWGAHMAGDIFYLLACSFATFSYWIFIAKPVFYSLMDGGTPLNPWQTILLFYLLVGASLSLIWFKRRYKSVFLKNKEVDHIRAIKIFIASITLLFLIEVVFLFVKIPVTNIKMNVLAMLYSTPIIFFVGLCVLGLEYIGCIKKNYFLNGWLSAILASLTYSLLTWNTKLYPARHIEYLMVPMCIVGAVGLKNLFYSNIDTKLFYRWKRRLSKTLIFPDKKFLYTPIRSYMFVGIVLAVILSNAVSVYPAGESLGMINETISDPCINAVEWINKNLDRNNSVIATDLRLSNFIWAEGFNATFDATNETWTATNWTDCIHDLDEKTGLHRRVSHILIDDVMREKVIYLGVWLSVHMTNESYEKFSRQPFELIYRNATVNQNMEEIHWTEIYAVNWTFIEKHLETL